MFSRSARFIPSADWSLLFSERARPSKATSQANALSDFVRSNELLGFFVSTFPSEDRCYRLVQCRRFIMKI